MNNPEGEIVKRSSMLIGLSGEAKHTVGEIKLPIYIKGVNSLQMFLVIDTLSSYNIILCRTWIHDMKFVPLAYHQYAKMPTLWGKVKIIVDRKEST